MTMAPPLVIAGPTASGKSGVALTLAEALNGAIICADSRQFYEGMVVGTAGPSERERAQVPHLLFHDFSPESPLDAARFVRLADEAIGECRKQAQQPILVGGTGLYLRSWRYGIDDAPPSDPQIREHFEARLRQEGIATLHAELLNLDPQAASRIHPNDPVRTVRALEIHKITQKPPSRLLPGNFAERPLRQTGHHVLIWPTLEWLRPRLQARAREMFNEELIKEVRDLHKRLPAENRLLKTMGYEEAHMYVQGKISEEEAIAQMIKRQWTYARRQRTWFKKENWWRVYPADQPNLARSILADWQDVGATS